MALCRCEKSVFRLVGESGSLLPGRHRDNNGFWNGHAFLALLPAEAQRWLELRGLDEELDALFDEGLEDA